jgi:hypothetical protein
MERSTATGTPASKIFINILRITCFCIFAGRAWQHLVWDAPFRTLLWDQEWMQHIIESITSMTWEEYTTSPLVDTYIQGAIKATGWFYAVCAMLSLFISRNMKRTGYVLIGGALSLSFLAFLDYKEKFYEAGMLLEHLVQVSAPLFLFAALFTKVQAKKLMVYAKAALALTFIGHGLYAWGYYPQPGPFIDMLINIMHFSESTARIILQVAAILDFAVAILIFIPRAARPALLYCIAWGGLTATARIASGFDSNFIAQSLNQYTFEVMFRLSHALVPMWVFYTEGKRVWQKRFVKKEETKQTAVATVTVIN